MRKSSILITSEDSKLAGSLHSYIAYKTIVKLDLYGFSSSSDENNSSALYSDELN